jgi:hypothetical protein
VVTQAQDLTPGWMSYDLRRLRLHGLIERIPKSHRYRLTPAGLNEGGAVLLPHLSARHPSRIVLAAQAPEP